jgi:hypothetical protein
MSCKPDKGGKECQYESDDVQYERVCKPFGETDCLCEQTRSGLAKRRKANGACLVDNPQ